MAPLVDVANMSSILPLAEIEGRFDKPLRLEQAGIDQLDELLARDPNGLLNTAFTVWNRYLRQHPQTDPEAVRDHIRRRGGSFLAATHAVIGEPVIKDISFSCCTLDDATLEDQMVAYLLVARVYPNNLHIADMNFVNPYKPILPKRRKFRFRKFKGLGLLPSVMARAESYAAAQQCEYMTLTAPIDDLVPLFGQFGFTVEDGHATSLAMEKRVAG